MPPGFENARRACSAGSSFAGMPVPVVLLIPLVSCVLPSVPPVTVEFEEPPLHAASNPRRSGAYSNLEWAVDRYDAAARKFRGRPAVELKWGTKLEFPGVMALIDVDAVQETLDRALAAPG